MTTLQRYRLKHRKAGLCYDCGEPVHEANGRRYRRCLLHLRQNMAERKKVVQKRKLNRLCINCGRSLGTEDAGYLRHARSVCLI